MNSEITWAPIFGADTRTAKKSNSASLRNVGAPATGYGLHAGDKLTFEKGTTIDNIEVVDQDPIRSGQRQTHLVACYIQGVKTWFNPMFLLRNKRVDGRNEPLYPEWARLGDAYAVVEQLIRQGGIEIPNKTFKAPVPAFDQTDGTPKFVAKVDDKGNKIVKEDGSYDMVRATEEREYPVVPGPIL
jgi:hypothetical protein